MNLRLAEFCFDLRKVVFSGAFVYIFAAGISNGWNLIETHHNPWASRSRENVDAVMGRKYRPCVTDAKRILTLEKP